VAEIGKAAPSFSLPDQDGKTVNLADLSGKIVVLEWVNPGCPYVQRHYGLGTMKNLAEKYKDKDVAWLAINTTKTATAEENKKWKEQHGSPYPYLLDADGSVGKMYGAKTTPHMYIIDKTGTLAYAGGIDSQATDNGPVAADTVNYVDKALGELTSGKSVSVAESKPYGCGVKYRD
jgi:peroxiredoxin